MHKRNEENLAPPQTMWGTMRKPCLHSAPKGGATSYKCKYATESLAQLYHVLDILRNKKNVRTETISRLISNAEPMLVMVLAFTTPLRHPPVSGA